MNQATQQQALITRHWCDVLRREAVDEHDNFFDLGGTSIAAIELASLVNQALGVGIDARLVFSRPTLAAFCDSLAQLPDREDADVSDAVSARDNWPLLPSQAWFFSKQFAHPEQFCVGLIFKAAAGLNLDALHHAIAMTVEHHDALRTQFRQSDHGWTQVPVHDAACVEHHDLADLDLDAQLRHIRDIGAAMAGALTFGTAPLLRLATIDLGPERGLRLLIVAHYLLGDRGSWWIVVEDIDAAYRWIMTGRRGASPLVATTSVRAWAVWLNSQTVAMDAQRQADYWLRLPPPAPLPIEEGHTPGRQEIVRRPLGEPAVTAILGAARRHRVNADVLLLAAFTQVIAEWCRTDRVTLDLISHARTPAPRGFNLSRTVGWLTRQAPLCVDLPADRRPSPMIRAITRALDDRPGDGIGYAALRFGPAVARGQVTAPFVDAPVCFNYLGNSNAGRSAPTLLTLSNERTGVCCEHPAFRPLELFCAIRDQQVTTGWSFDADAIRHTVIEQLSARFEHHAMALAAEPSRV